jgi:hypothetical protein
LPAEPFRRLPKNPNPKTDTFLLQSRLAPKSVSVYGSSSCSYWQRRDPSQHAPKRPPREVTLRQQQPIITGVLDQTSAYFHQPMLQARQGPSANSLRQHEVTPQVAQVVKRNFAQSNIVAHRSINVASKLISGFLKQNFLFFLVPGWLAAKV